MLQGGILHLLHLILRITFVCGTLNTTIKTIKDILAVEQSNNMNEIKFPEALDQISSDLLFSTTNSTQSSDINEATLLMSSQTSLPFTVPIGAFAVPSSSQALLSVLSTKSTNPLGNTNNNLNQNHNNNNKSHTQNMKNQKIMILKPTTSVMNSTLKVGKTNAPMLNYIYDAHVSSNKYHHHDHRYGPHFEDINSRGNITNVTVQAGNTAYLNCRISLLQDKTVSWVRRKHDGDNLQLLTVGMHTYSGDSRYTVDVQYPNNWRLRISYANKRDEGLYECQISTHPPKVIKIFLKVNAPEVTIIDEHGFPLLDKYYEVDSTIQLVCKVRYISMSSSVVYWLHGNRTLNYDITRGGISVKTDLMDNGANSVLFIAKVNKSDSGNYTCSIGSNIQFTTTVHVLNESLAELYHGGCNNFLHLNFILFLLTINIIIFHFIMSIR